MRGKIMRKSAALALGCMLAVSAAVLPPVQALFPALTAAAEDAAYVEGTLDGLTYQKYADHVVISKGDPTLTDVVIPETIEGLPVTRIGNNAFEEAAVTTLKLPPALQEIGEFAFFQCGKLTAVDIPGTVAVVEKNAFGNCSALVDLTLHEGTRELRQGAFSTCGFTSVTLPESLGVLRAGAFSWCSKLEEVNFPERQVDVYSGVFSETPWLRAMREKDPLVIVNGTLIDGYTCKGDVVIPDDVTIISAEAFSLNMGITSVVVPASVKDIWDRTFSYCLNLEKVEIRGARYIGPEAFGTCTKLTDVKLPGTLTEVGEDAFDGITTRMSWQFGGTQEQYKAITVGANNMLFKIGIPKYGVLGDVDWNTKVEVADVIAMQKWLLQVPGAGINNLVMADLDTDGDVDVFDLARLKRILTKK